MLSCSRDDFAADDPEAPARSRNGDQKEADRLTDLDRSSTRRFALACRATSRAGRAFGDRSASLLGFLRMKKLGRSRLSIAPALTESQRQGAG